MAKWRGRGESGFVGTRKESRCAEDVAVVKHYMSSLQSKYVVQTYLLQLDAKKENTIVLLHVHCAITLMWKGLSLCVPEERDEVRQGINTGLRFTMAKISDDFEQM